MSPKETRSSRRATGSGRGSGRRHRRRRRSCGVGPAELGRALHVPGDSDEGKDQQDDQALVEQGGLERGDDGGVVGAETRAHARHAQVVGRGAQQVPGNCPPAKVEPLGASELMVQAVDLLTRLALQARAGDTRALGRFVEAGYQEVWRFCASLISGKEADDLCQETFARAVKALPNFRGDSSARTWLLSIARHTCADEVRARSRRRRQEAIAAGTQEVMVADPSGDVTVADLIGQLEGDRRQLSCSRR